MKLKNPILRLSQRELIGWIAALAVITLSFLLTSNDYLTLISSLLGVTTLVFVSKGLVGKLCQF
jgi:nicotinamide riboside transporter PnuC